MKLLPPSEMEKAFSDQAEVGGNPCDKQYKLTGKCRTTRADFFNSVYFRRGLTSTIGLAKDLIDGLKTVSKT